MMIRRGLIGRGSGKLKRAKPRSVWRLANAELRSVLRNQKKLVVMMNTYNETDLEMIQRYGALEVIKQYGDNAAIHAIAQACLRDSGTSATAVYNTDRATLVPPPAPEPTLLYPTWVADERSAPYRSRLRYLPAAVTITIACALVGILVWLVISVLTAVATAVIAYSSVLIGGVVLLGLIWVLSLFGGGRGRSFSGTFQGRIH
jgi:hypothetical protein